MNIFLLILPKLQLIHVTIHQLIFFPLLYFSDGYTVSDVVMYWRDQPVVGVEKAELPQFTIKKFETNERKIKLATGMQYFFLIKLIFFFLHKNQFLKTITIIFMLYYRYLPEVIPLFQTPKKHWLFCVSNISSINFNCDAFLGLILDQS